MEKILVKSLIIRNDLEEAKSEILAKGMVLAIAHIKTACIAFHNLCEFEISVRSIYELHRDLSESYTDVRQAADFFSYLRNKFVGHISNELIDKTLEWKPEVFLSLDREHDAEIILIYNFLLIETAINTYVDPDGGHKMFQSETDLNYPPDVDRFLDLIITSISQASAYLKKVEDAVKPTVSVPKIKDLQIELYKKAGMTKFSFIRGKKR